MAKPSMETHGQPCAIPFQEGKFQPQKTPIKVSYSFYLFGAMTPTFSLLPGPSLLAYNLL